MSVLAEPRRGEIVLEHATRTFSVRADQARTLRGLMTGRRSDPAHPAPVPALADVSLRITPGETVGMVGRNGAGKTSTLKVLAGIIPLQSGVARCTGRVVSLLELPAGFSRDFTGRENIYLQGALFGFDRREIESRLDQIIAFSELEGFIEVPVRTYSQGMLLRLGFSIAAHLDADVMLIDEVLAVGDEAFQRKCLRRISEQIAAGATLLLVSHDPGSIERVCGRVIVLDAGHVVFDGPTAEGLLHYHRLMGTEHGDGDSLRPRGSQADPLEVAELELRDGAGRRGSVFRSGSPVSVAVGLRAHGQVSSPCVLLELRSQDGTLIHRSRAPVELDPGGAASLAFQIGELALLGGDYDLSLGAGETRDEVALQRTVRFSVPEAPGAEGLMDLRGSWRALVMAPGRLP